MRASAALASALSLLAFGCTKGPSATSGCQTNLDCKSGQTCVDGTCTGTATTVDCGKEAACNADANCGAKGRCEGGCCLPSCAKDEDCGEAMVCRESVCVEEGAPCVENADCAGNVSAPVCEVSTGTCVGCLSDHDCQTGQTCSNHGCETPVTTGCSSDADCTQNPDLPHCLIAEEKCVGCLTDQQCVKPPNGTVTCDPANFACRDVYPGCGIDADCASSPLGKHCDASTRTCVACLQDSDCPAGQHCTREHACQAATGCTPGTSTGCPHGKVCRSDRTCVECLSPAQCKTGQICQANHCVARVNGCWEKSMCWDPTPACDLTTRTCVACRNDADCSNRFCENGTCVKCASDIDCAESTLISRPYCDNGHCEECQGDVNCSNGQVCVDGTCGPDPTDTPCPEDGVCPRQLVCTDPDGAGSYCRTPCDPYAAGNPCPDGKRCALAYFSGGLPQGACVPVNSGLPQQGAPCSVLQPCDVGLVCVPDGADQGACRRLCNPNASSSACGSGTACQAVVDVDPLGVPHAVGACFPPSRYLEACSSDASCDAGQVCAPGPNPQLPTQFRNECTWPVGTRGGGEPCDRDTDCKSGLCLLAMPAGLGAQGFCMGGCTSDSDCPARVDAKKGGACESYPVPWHDQSGAPTTVQLDTCVAQCTEDLECPSGMTCVAVPDATSTSFVTRCQAWTSVQAGKGGAPCASGADCRSGDCIIFGSRTVGICQAVCGPSGNQNCAAGAVCPADGVMQPVRSGAYAPAPICWTRPCATNADCGAGRVCGAQLDPTNANDFVLSCQPAEGSGGGGAPCTQPTDCATNFCVSWGSGGRCFGTCSTGADCATGSRCASWSQAGGADVCVPQ